MDVSFLSTYCPEFSPLCWDDVSYKIKSENFIVALELKAQM